MRVTMTLDKKDLAEAIDKLVESRGWKRVGDITVSHYAGDMREPAETTVSVQVESMGASK